jgi:hypothetical protein
MAEGTTQFSEAASTTHLDDPMTYCHAKSHHWLLSSAIIVAACGGPSGPPESSVDFTSTSPFFVTSEAAAPLAPKTPAPGAGAADGMQADDTSEASATDTPATASPAAAQGAGGQPAAAASPAAMAGATAEPASNSSGAGIPAAAMSAGSGATATAGGPAMKAAVAGDAAMPVAGAAGDGAVEVVKATKLTVEFTTKTYGAKWAPDNVGAVWIADARGRWIYTLEEWAGLLNHALNLVTYTGAGGPDYSAGLFAGTYTSGSPPPADVIATATLHAHKTHKGAAWSFKDSTGKVVADGMYKLMFEMTEQETTDKTLEIPFMKGAPAGPIMAAGNAVFADVRVALQ